MAAKCVTRLMEQIEHAVNESGALEIHYSFLFVHIHPNYVDDAVLNVYASRLWCVEISSDECHYLIVIIVFNCINYSLCSTLSHCR
jgi:hypothetical protein